MNNKMTIHFNTRKLTCVVIILSLFFIVCFTPLLQWILMFSCVLALFIPIFGWKDIIFIRLILTSFSIIISFNMISGFFFMDLWLGISVIVEGYLLGLGLLFLSYRLLQKRLIY